MVFDSALTNALMQRKKSCSIFFRSSHQELCMIALMILYNTWLIKWKYYKMKRNFMFKKEIEQNVLSYEDVRFSPPFCINIHLQWFWMQIVGCGIFHRHYHSEFFVSYILDIDVFVISSELEKIVHQDCLIATVWVCLMDFHICCVVCMDFFVIFCDPASICTIV